MINNIESALAYINADDREIWIKVGMAIKSELGDHGHSIWNTWSQQSESYNERSAKSAWRSFKNAGVSISSLFYEAKQNGWTNNSKPYLVKATSKPVQINETNSTKIRATKAWNLSTPAPSNHTYLINKNIQPHGIGVLGCIYFDAPRFVRNHGNLLVIPMMDYESNVWSIQFINELGNKAYLRGQRKPGLFYWIKGETNIIYLCEGFATGATLNEETGNAVACAFDAHSLIHVAKELIKRFSKEQIVIMADDDWQTTGNPGIKAATKAANEIGAQIRVPDFSGLLRGEKDSDFNDYQRLRRLCNG